MEVVREVFKPGSAHGARAAIRADQKSYSLVPLISSALDVRNIWFISFPSPFVVITFFVRLGLKFSTNWVDVIICKFKLPQKCKFKLYNLAETLLVGLVPSGHSSSNTKGQ